MKEDTEKKPSDDGPSTGSWMRMHRQTVQSSKGMSPAVLLGSSMALAMGLFAWGGMKWDDRFGTEPWGILVGVTLGLLFGVYEVWKVTRPLPEEEREPPAEREDP